MFIEERDRHKHNFMQNKDSHFVRSESLSDELI